ncbi:MAG: 30S ribosomal protein S6 [Anaerolineae bacterium]|nr:30S ribosomal protein S6 [Anaerolineae bacterium]
MREYELTMVVQPTLENDAVKALLEQVGAIITSAGGQVTQVGQLADNTGQIAAAETFRRRRLAYPLGRAREAYYPVCRMQAPSNALTELERQLKLNENVLRYLVIRTDE